MSWIDVKFSLDVNVTQIAGDSTGQYLIASCPDNLPTAGGIYYSSNGGASWGQGIITGTSTPVPNGWAVASSSNGGTMYASGGTGGTSGQIVYTSTDGGEHWTQLGSQPSLSGYGTIRTILCNANGDLNSLIVLTTGGKVFKYSSGWSQLFSTVPIAAIGRDNTVIVAVAGNPNTTPPGGFAGIYYSTNNGSTWSSLDNRISIGIGGAYAGQYYNCITFGNGTCYIGSSGSGLIGNEDNDGVVISCASASINGSETWTPVTDPGYSSQNIQIFGEQLYILSNNLASLTAGYGAPSSGLGGLITVNLSIPGSPVTADPFITNNPPPVGTSNYNCTNIYVSTYSGLRFLSVDKSSDNYGLLRSNNNICFKEGTKILCLVDNKEVYLPIETITPGTLVKTSLDGYKKVELIGSSKLYNPGNSLHSMKRLYVCKQANYPELLENLILTGDHSILVPDITEKQRADMNEYMGRIFVTDRKYRLMACLDSRAEPYTEEGIHTIWNLALENESYYGNYGIYANGLLVETCSIRMIKEMSGIELTN